MVLWTKQWYYGQNYGTIYTENYGTSFTKLKEENMVDYQNLRNFDFLEKILL